jgi:hypothetical protein
MRGLLTTMALIVAALAPVAPALADPPPPPPPPPPAPAFIPLPAGIGNALAQSGTQPGGLLGLPDLSAYGSNLLLGQSPGPVAPGAPAPAVVPNLSAFNPEYLLGQNTAPAAPGDGAPAPGLGPDQDSPGTGRIAFLRRIYEMYQDGALKGSLLGQQSPEQFAGPPVAAPPPAG